VETDEQYAKALQALRESAQHDPTLAEAWIRVAAVHYALKADIECVSAADEVLK
jgi:hypothetical protein